MTKKNENIIVWYSQTINLDFLLIVFERESLFFYMCFIFIENNIGKLDNF